MTIILKTKCNFKVSSCLKKNIAKTINKILNYFNFPHNIEIGITFVKSKYIRFLNKKYRKIDKVTDVLSFPMLEFEIPYFISNQIEDETLVIGDVVICAKKAISQAHEIDHSIMREIIFLIIHSILHLLGYDHQTDEEEKKMFEIQNFILKEIDEGW